jgi:hypothetical protein
MSGSVYVLFSDLYLTTPVPFPNYRSVVHPYACAQVLLTMLSKEEAHLNSVSQATSTSLTMNPNHMQHWREACIKTMNL